MILRKLRKFWQHMYMVLADRPVPILIALLGMGYLSTTCIIMVCEGKSLPDALIRGLPSFLGELGEPGSPSVLVQVAVLGSLFISIIFLAVITATLTTAFVKLAMRGGRIVKSVKASDHIVICGWNFQGEKIVHELIASNIDKDIVILARSEHRPVKEESVLFISGDPTQDEDLIRAGIKTAESVIILSDLRKSANEADAEALMITLAVESLNRATHTSVQVVNTDNRIHLERAHADEIICLDQMGGSLVVASAVNHGVSQVLNDLLTFDTGSEIYRYDAPLSDELVGKEFSEAVHILAQRRIILLAFETNYSEELVRQLPDDVLHPNCEDNRVIIVNPQGECRLRQGDALFIIAESHPKQL